MTAPLVASPGHAETVIGNPRQYTLDEKRMYLDSGLLGRLFGSAANAPTNVAGFVVCVLVVAGVVLFGNAPDSNHVETYVEKQLFLS